MWRNTRVGIVYSLDAVISPNVCIAFALRNNTIERKTQVLYRFLPKQIREESGTNLRDEEEILREKFLLAAICQYETGTERRYTRHGPARPAIRFDGG